MADEKSQNKNTRRSPVQKKEEELEKKLAEIQQKEAEDKYKILAQQLNLPYSDLVSIPVDTDALSLLNEEEARSANIAVIFKKDSKIIVAATDPANPTTQKIISRLKEDREVEVILTNPRSLQNILKRYQDIKKAETFEIGAIEIQEGELDRLEKEINNTSDLKSRLQKVSTTGLLELLVAGALKTGASDVHLEPESNSARLRYRIDGLLHDIAVIDRHPYEKALDRIKVLSKMKLNVRGVPQDGRFTIRQKSVSIEVRVSVLPSEFGETIVMRLLDPRTIKQDIGELGMRDDLLNKVKEVLKKPTGAILTTGPTGSGKTTMLYAFVNHLNSPDKKIVTIEDPIEYHIEDISQTQVDARRGYTFANGLRAIVRQDPDIMLVGEIRDTETADIALQAALTGHLVLSTIHTNDAAGTVPRLIDLGIRPQIIAPAINMAMAQRLVRKLCPECKKMRKAEEAELKKLQEVLGPLSKYRNVDMPARSSGGPKYPKLDAGLEIGTPGKCKECNESGYKGRIGVFEAFEMSREIERLILKSPAISEVRDLAIAEGMITMLQDAYIKLIEGVTSMEEIERVLG
ncbi:MAG: type II/IV secretion system protein [Candidatus Yanofskybacteria bacterium]|nr:type II/IV secretion system protein [Candidatus Yanofskybacteria bacterium]